MEDQAAIVSYLRENKIPYRLDPSANAILMPRGQVYETRLSLAQEGLPRGGSKGFELFDNTSMGLSEFQQRITYVRAIEGELERTIAQMDAVDTVRVSVVIPEQRLFLEQQKPSTASVLLRLRPGTTLGQNQVKSIIHLVSHSVDGLQPEDVTVVDTGGRILSDMIADSMIIYPPDGRSSVTSVQRELERQRERELESKARLMLEQVFGPGKVVVRVKVDLDFDKRSRSLVEYTPNPETGQGVPRSNQREEENYNGQGQPAASNPGTTTNIPGYAINTQNVNSEYNKGTSTTNYEITTRKSDEVVTPRGVKSNLLEKSGRNQPQITQQCLAIDATLLEMAQTCHQPHIARFNKMLKSFAIGRRQPILQPTQGGNIAIVPMAELALHQHTNTLQPRQPRGVHANQVVFVLTVIQRWGRIIIHAAPAPCYNQIGPPIVGYDRNIATCLA